MIAWYRVLRQIIFPPSITGRVYLAVLVTGGLNIFFGLMFYLVEHEAQADLTLWDSFWWAIVTMATVGYGDFYPVTNIGRYLIAYPCFIVGIGLLGYLLGLFAEAVIEHTSRKRRGLMSVKFQNHIIICNCPEESRVLELIQQFRAHESYRDREYVLISGELTENPDRLRQAGVKFVKGNPMHEETLTKANLRECAGVVVLANSSEDQNADALTFVIGALVERVEAEIGRPINVVLEQVDIRNDATLRRAGTDGIVYKGGITDNLMVQEFLYPGIYEVFKQLTNNTVGSQLYLYSTCLEELEIAEIQRVCLDHDARIQVIGIATKDGEYRLNPAPKTQLSQGDQLILLAERHDSFTAVENDILERQKRAVCD